MIEKDPPPPRGWHPPPLRKSKKTSELEGRGFPCINRMAGFYKHMMMMMILMMKREQPADEKSTCAASPLFVATQTVHPETPPIVILFWK